MSWLNNIPFHICTTISLSIHPSMDLYIASNILAVVNSASTNKGVHISFPNSVFVFLELIPRSTITLGFINLSHYFGVGVSTVIISPLIFIIPFLLLTLGFDFFLISLDCSVCCLFEDILLIFLISLFLVIELYEFFIYVWY